MKLRREELYVDIGDMGDRELYIDYFDWKSMGNADLGLGKERLEIGGRLAVMVLPRIYGVEGGEVRDFGVREIWMYLGDNYRSKEV